MTVTYRHTKWNHRNHSRATSALGRKKGCTGKNSGSMRRSDCGNGRSSGNPETTKSMLQKQRHCRTSSRTSLAPETTSVIRTSNPSSTTQSREATVLQRPTAGKSNHSRSVVRRTPTYKRSVCSHGQLELTKVLLYADAPRPR